MLANHAPAANDSPQGDSDQSHSDYDTILAALMESARGRSFLQEYALRNRVAETATLLAAIGRIEGLLTSGSLEPGGPADAAPPEAVAELDVAPVLMEPSAAEPDTIESEIQPHLELPETEIAALVGTARTVPATESFGPDLLSPRPESRAPTPQDVSAKTQTRDPFADIRALSYEEKVALFA